MRIRPERICIVLIARPGNISDTICVNVYLRSTDAVPTIISASFVWIGVRSRVEIEAVAKIIGPAVLRIIAVIHIRCHSA